MIYYFATAILFVIEEKVTGSVCVFSPAVEKLEIVECDLEKKDSIQPALGNASVVICCIGASEKEISDITGPYRIDYLATKNLVDAGKLSKQFAHCPFFLSFLFHRCLFVCFMNSNICKS